MWAEIVAWRGRRRLPLPGPMFKVIKVKAGFGESVNRNVDFVIFHSWSTCFV